MAQGRFFTGHVVPEALLGGPIALVKDGDTIVIDTVSRTINWLVDEEEQARRRKEWEAAGPYEFREKRGILYKYARDVAVRCLFCDTRCVVVLTTVCPVVARQSWCIYGLKM